MHACMIARKCCDRVLTAIDRGKNVETAHVEHAVTARSFSAQGTVCHSTAMTARPRHLETIDWTGDTCDRASRPVF